MRFNKKTSDQNTKFKKIAKGVAQEYLKYLNNSAMFRAQLNNCMVNLCEIPIKEIQGFSYNTPSKDEITVFYDERKTSERLVAFAIAHEMAHMLFYNKNNRAANYSGIICKKDGFAVELRNNPVPIELEEAMADYLALYIISKMNFDDDNGQLDLYLAPRQERLNLIKEVEPKYGKPLVECTRIDEYTKNGDKVELANALWYDAVTHCLNLKLD